LNSSVTLHRILEGESVELVIPLYSPLLEKIQIKRHGDIRKAKIYYFRHLRGKSARIKERYIKKTKPLDSASVAVEVPVSDNEVAE